MNDTFTRTSPVRFTCEPSEAGRRRLLSRRGEPIFVAGWHRVLMIHFEVDAQVLQCDVPFQLDLHEGRAFVSAVAFTMSGMRPRLGGRFSAWMFSPIATHDFLNLRTYVRHRDECGIHFLAEWLSSRLAAKLGPAAFGLPYRHGRLDYDHGGRSGTIQGQVADPFTGNKLAYHGTIQEALGVQPCEAGSLNEWLMERYTAFNSAGWRKGFFRVWHPPWPQRAASIKMDDVTLLTQRWPWFKEAHLIGANYSPGFNEVWMGRPHLVNWACS